MTEKKSQSELFSHFSETSYPLTLELAGETIEVRPYLHKESKKFLELYEEYRNKKSGGIKNLLYAQKNLIDACITTDDVSSSDIHRADFIAVMNKVREVTKGEDQKIKFRCTNKENCRDENKQPYVKEFDFLFEDAVLKNKDNVEESRVIETEENIQSKIYLKPYTFGVMIENADFFDSQVYKGVPSSDLITKFYASFIDRIEISETELYENLPKKMRVKFLDRLSDKDLKKIIDAINKEPTYVWKKEWECPVCGAKNISVLDDVVDYFL